MGYSAISKDENGSHRFVDHSCFDTFLACQSKVYATQNACKRERTGLWIEIGMYFTEEKLLAR